MPIILLEDEAPPPVDSHQSSASPHLAEWKLRPREGDDLPDSTRAGVGQEPGPFQMSFLGAEGCSTSCADCCVGFCFSSCFTSGPLFSSFYFIVPFLSFCFSYCVTDINSLLENPKKQKEEDTNHITTLDNYCSHSKGCLPDDVMFHHVIFLVYMFLLCLVIKVTFTKLRSAARVDSPWSRSSLLELVLPKLSHRCVVATVLAVPAHDWSFYLQNIFI